MAVDDSSRMPDKFNGILTLEELVRAADRAAASRYALVHGLSAKYAFVDWVACPMCRRKGAQAAAISDVAMGEDVQDAPALKVLVWRLPI